MCVLAIGVHPDDVEFGMGATLTKHISMGHELQVIVLADGARDEVGNYTRSDEIWQESKEALKILGYEKEIIFLNLHKVDVRQSTIKVIEKEIENFRPDRIYTHSKNDRHQDHRNYSYTVLSAGRYINEILLFEVYSAFPEFLPNYIINISRELFDLKIQALNCYKN